MINTSTGSKLVRLLKEHTVLVIADIVAVYLSLSGWNYYDVKYFIAWHDEYFVNGRILDVYSSNLKVAYPPLAVLTFVLFHHLATTISPSSIIVWRLVDKLPLLVSFNAVYFLLRRKYGKLASYLWLLNLVAYSTINAYQFDLLVALFILLAMISIEKRHYQLYGFFSTLATLIKQSVALIAVLPVVELLSKRSYGELAKYMLVVFATGVVFIAPFLTVAPYCFFEKVLLFHAKRPPQQLSVWAIPAYMVNYDLSKLPSWIGEAWVIALALFVVWVLYSFSTEISTEKSGDLGLVYAKFNTILLSGFLVLSKVSNINYFIWLSIPLIVFIAKTREYRFTRKLVELYLFASLAITTLFGILSTFVQVVAGYPIFVFEDWKWIPTDEFFVKGYAYEPFDTIYLAALYMRSVPALREPCKSLASTHNYFLALLCAIYACVLCYTVKIALKTSTKKIP